MLVTDCGRARAIWLLDQIEGELYSKGGAEVLRDAQEEARREADLLFPPRHDAAAETMDHLRMRLQILTQRLDHL